MRYLFLILVFIAIEGCKKPLNYSYAFDVNGNDYKGNSYSAYYQYDTTAMLEEFAANFYIGNVSDTNYVQISFSGNRYIVPGNYYSGIVNPNNTVCSFAYYKNHIFYNNVSGIVQIVQMDTIGHKITGNFQFKAVNAVSPGDSVTISNGAFSGISYIIE